MKKVYYLTAPVLILGLFVLGCGQGAPTASSGKDVASKIDTPAVSSVDEAGPQLTPELAGNPTGNCCPEGFDLEFEPGNSTDRNGDDRVCRRVTAGVTITVDNNAPGECVRCPDGTVPPCV